MEVIKYTLVKPVAIAVIARYSVFVIITGIRLCDCSIRVFSSVAYSPNNGSTADTPRKKKNQYTIYN